MKRLLIALLLLLTAFPVARGGNVGAWAKVEDPKALEKGLKTEVTIVLACKPVIDPPELEFAGEVHYLGKEKKSDGYHYRYRIKPRGRGIFTLAVARSPGDPAEVLTSVEVWELDGAEQYDGKAFTTSPSNRPGTNGMEDKSLPSSSFGEYWGIIFFIGIIAFILFSLSGLGKKIFSREVLSKVYASLAVKFLHDMSNRDKEEAIRRFLALEYSKPLPLPSGFNAAYCYPYLTAPVFLLFFGIPTEAVYFGLEGWTFLIQDYLSSLIGSFVLWIIIASIVIEMELHKDEWKESRFGWGSPRIYVFRHFFLFGIFVWFSMPFQSNYPLYIFMILLLLGEIILKWKKPAYYKMHSPCPQTNAQEQLMLLKQEFVWKEKKKKRGFFVAVPERSKFVRIYVECDGEDFHVAVIHLLNPLSPIPMLLLAEIQDAIARLAPKRA